MNLHLISFGAPDKKYVYTRTRFYNEALNLGVFASIKVFSELESFEYTKDLLDHKDFLYSTRGFGYWIWKYFLISKLMCDVKDDDVILYCDSGCTLNPNGLSRLKYYVNTTYECGSLVFDVGHPEFKYTKMDTYNRVFKNDLSHLETNQICATVFFLKNTSINRNIIEKIKSILIERNYHYATDEQSELQNDSRFLEHRHDQSVFSLIAKQNNFFVIPDETYWNPDWNVSGKKYPIWATRLRQ
jgi:hypothetical protein